jgi:parallel beta-helix repeat protein
MARPRVSTPALLTRPILISFAAVLFLFTFAASAQSNIHVPTDQATIQGAINIANNGDMVLVAPGTYSENINFNGKAITMTSSGGASVTIIDGGAHGPVVTFDTGETSTAVLNGFTVQNGSATIGPNYDGGGIFINSASPTITNNIIQNNVACADGAGIAVEGGAAPRIQGNTIKNNAESGCYGGWGGGIYVGGTNPAQIIGNVIENNKVAGDGGGIGIFSTGAPTISNNIISGNTATGTFPACQGGGIFSVNNSNPLILQNLIYNNTAGQGGGVCFNVVAGARGPVLVNNTIIGGSGSTLGSAVYGAEFDNQVQLFNNIMTGPSGQNVVYCDTEPASFINNDAYSPSGTAFGGMCGDQIGQNGNFSADPLFVNAAANDYHLQSTSPAIDAGANTAPNLPQTDFAGNPRIVDGNNDCVSTVDLGIYEFAPTVNANAFFSTNALTFPNQVIGTPSRGQQVTLANSGNTCFQFLSLGTSGDFSQTNSCSPAGIPGGTSCVFNVTFTPTALGPRSGTLAVTGSDSITTKTPNVSLTGTGVDFSISEKPSAATVKAGSSAQFTVTLTPIRAAVPSAVALSCSGLPTAASCSFSPPSVIPGSDGANSTLTLSTGSGTPTGKFSVQITGSSGATSHTTNIQLTVK